MTPCSGAAGQADRAGHVGVGETVRRTSGRRGLAHRRFAVAQRETAGGAGLRAAVPRSRGACSAAGLAARCVPPARAPPPAARRTRCRGSFCQASWMPDQSRLVSAAVAAASGEEARPGIPQVHTSTTAVRTERALAFGRSMGIVAMGLSGVESATPRVYPRRPEADPAPQRPDCGCCGARNCAGDGLPRDQRRGGSCPVGVSSSMIFGM